MRQFCSTSEDSEDVLEELARNVDESLNDRK